jgi:hypothetical protein
MEPCSSSPRRGLTTKPRATPSSYPRTLYSIRKKKKADGPGWWGGGRPATRAGAWPYGGAASTPSFPCPCAGAGGSPATGQRAAAGALCWIVASLHPARLPCIAVQRRALQCNDVQRMQRCNDRTSLRPDTPELSSWHFLARRPQCAAQASKANRALLLYPDTAPPTGDGQEKTKAAAKRRSPNQTRKGPCRTQALFFIASERSKRLTPPPPALRPTPRAASARRPAPIAVNRSLLPAWRRTRHRPGRGRPIPELTRPG